MPGRPLFVFDFDGTLCDSAAAAFELLRTLAARHRFRVVGPADGPALRELSSRELIRFLAIPAWKLPLIVRQARREFLALVPALRPIAGMPVALAELRRRQAGLGILTSNGLAAVTRFLDQEELTVDFVRAGSSLFGKVGPLRQIVARHRATYAREQIYYVGDETRDVLAARRAGVRTVAVTWGYQSAAVLRRSEPEFLLADPAELVALADETPP